MQTPLYCMGIGISVGIRSMISWVLEVGGNSKAKLMTKVYYLYTCLISILIGVIILTKGKAYISIFTQIESISINL
jgi:Na+-driven multidrug efflux pump